MSLKEELSSVVFWDVDMRTVDFDKQAAFFIQRVLEYGELHDWKLILSYYTQRTRDSLPHPSLNFIINKIS